MYFNDLPVEWNRHDKKCAKNLSIKLLSVHMKQRYQLPCAAGVIDFTQAASCSVIFLISNAFHC